jgi:virginiamycin A acetyltransferase
MSGHTSSARALAKDLAFALATLAVIPMLLSYRLRALVLGRDRAFEGSTQLLSFFPGVSGQYLRRAFLARVLRRCARTATVEFGTTFSKVDAQIDEHVYVGPGCRLGLVHLERDVMLAPGVHIPSGGRTHGVDDVSVPMWEQPGSQVLVRIGHGAWIGSAAVVMADVGPGTVVGAGAVVTRPLPAWVMAGGIPARVLRSRSEAVHHTAPAQQVG